MPFLPPTMIFQIFHADMLRGKTNQLNLGMYVFLGKRLPVRKFVFVSRRCLITFDIEALKPPLGLRLQR